MIRRCCRYHPAYCGHVLSYDNDNKGKGNIIQYTCINSWDIYHNSVTVRFSLGLSSMKVK